MTASFGLRFFTMTAIALACFVTQATAQEKTDLSKYKTQLAAAASAAKPVGVAEKLVLTPHPSSKPPIADIEAVNEADLVDINEEQSFSQEVNDSPEIEPLRLSLDKPAIVRLDRDAVNVIVGSNENLRVVPDTNKTLLLIAKKPGSTYFQALDVDGRVIMQRQVLIGSPSKNYIRVRRACANGSEGCKQYSVYYCPDICHEVNVVQDAAGPASAIPEETPMGSSNQGGSGNNNNGSAVEATTTAEPPPGE